MIGLTDILDRFLPESLRSADDKKLLYRARITVGITLMYFSSQLSLALMLLALAYLNILVLWPATLSCALAATCYLFQMIYFKKTGNLFVASLITMAILFSFTSRFIYITGGWNSSVILFLFVVPMCAFLITGHKRGMIWSMLSIGVYGILGLLEYAGIAAPQVVPAEYETLLKFFIWVFSWFMIVGGVMLYSGIVNSLNASINHEKERMRLKATFDEESGAYTRKVFNQLLMEKMRVPEVGIKSFALIFMELIQQKSGSIAAHRHEMLRAIFNGIKHQLGDRVIVSRYGSLSMTALISYSDGNDAARNMLNNLYDELQHAVDRYDATLCLGAVIVPNGFSDINTMTDDAREALHHAKLQPQKFVVTLKGEKKKDQRDYLSRAFVASFDQIIKRAQG